MSIIWLYFPYRNELLPLELLAHTIAIVRHHFLDITALSLDYSQFLSDRTEEKKLIGRNEKKAYWRFLKNIGQKMIKTGIASFPSVGERIAHIRL